MSLTFYALLWPHPGTTDALIAYEDKVLPLVTDHGARYCNAHEATAPTADHWKCSYSNSPPPRHSTPT
jgi:hypothetical protein